MENKPPAFKNLSFAQRAVLKNLGATDAWRARPSDPRERALIEDLKDIAQKRGITVPPLLIYKSDKPNAVSMPGAVAVATNLIDITDRAQLKAVIGHELSHTRHRPRDLGIMGIIGLVTQSLAVWFVEAKKKAKRPLTRFKQELIYIAGGLVELALIKVWGRHMEYEADKEGAEMSSPKAMSEALLALKGRQKELEAEQEEKRREHYQAMPEWQKKIADAYNTIEPNWVKRIRRKPMLILDIHPPTDSRIERLRRMEDSQSPQPSL